MPNAGGQDAQLRDARGQQTGAIGTDQAHAPFLEVGHHLDHVHGGHTLSDADDELAPGVGSFVDGAGGAERGHENHGGIDVVIGDSLFDRVVYGHRILELLSSTPGRDPGKNLGSIGKHLT